jgi:ubiquinone/menaquinone biosynthesis C-methylase UbiE
MRADPSIAIFNQDYEPLVYGDTLSGRVMRRGHSLLEKPFNSRHSFARVLEVGAGPGIHLPFVKHHFDEYCLTDASEHVLALAPEMKGVHKMLENATALSFKDASFDRLIAAHVLEHLPQPHKVLREWVRVLKPAGILSIILPCDPGLLYRIGRSFGPRQRFTGKGFDYAFLQAVEHINSIHNLTAFISYYFDQVDAVWWPSRIPLPDINITYIANIRV